MKRNRSLVSVLTALGLLLLFLMNISPILLLLRQAFSPESESVGWPLRLLPRHFSLENFRLLWRSQALAEHVFLSGWVALLVTFFSLTLGFPAGWGAARWRALEGVSTRASLLSRILPHIALAIPLTSLLIPLGLYNHPKGWGLILAHLTLGVPIAVLMGYAAFRDLPRELEEAAIVDGCSTVKVFTHVSLPVVKGALGAAAILIFLLSWDEFTYALLIQLTHRTMPPLIYYYTEYGQIGSASVLAVLMLVPAVLVIGVLQKSITRGMMSGILKG